ncbi:MAG: UDP-N-acetylmuramoyl-L-alanyl-D-glutamate--2,6-diaminopimelate ligase [Chloroflexi bacterium]|nr:UDP-N-acetylmuramoyl-L-alanyl-D-glutamate--2,6-diaminopimelate ligase [Chloroflexota bacterium]
MKLSTLLSALPHAVAPLAADPDITAVAHDSRQVGPGALFVAARGENADGHRFIADAIARGAVAVVYDDPSFEPSDLQPPISHCRVPDSREALAYLSAAFNGFPARRLVMIGITGTDGKTTTAILLHTILTHAGYKTGLISTVNAMIGHEILDTGLHTTTPDAPEVQAYLARMAAAGMTHCILETTSHGLAQHRVTACDFDVAIVTNITHEHLDYHGTREAYGAAKAKLFEGLATANRKPGQDKVAVLNLDDESYEYLRGRIGVGCCAYSIMDRPERPEMNLRAKETKPDKSGCDGVESASADFLPYSPAIDRRADARADVVARHIEFTPTATRFDVVGDGISFPIETPLVGRYNVSNCLAAITAAIKALHVSPEAVQSGIAAVRGVPGRMERIDLGQPFTAIVDFAHTPNALIRALETARKMTGGRVIAVFGSAGLRDRAKRRMMPEASARLADVTILTAEDPRAEPLDAILREMAEACAGAGGVEGKTFWRVPDRGEAIRFALSLARPGDLVIACGKGHEQSMCFGTVEYPWDDRVAMRAALAEYLGVAGPAMPRLPTSL